MRASSVIKVLNSWEIQGCVEKMGTINIPEIPFVITLENINYSHK